jgi:hypothetical protein
VRNAIKDKSALVFELNAHFHCVSLPIVTTRKLSRVSGLGKKIVRDIYVANV